MTTQYEEGDPRSRLIVLGQAPSHAETRYNRPLVGAAGMVFRDCIQAAGLARGSCYILNVWEDPVQTDQKTGLIYQDNELLWTKKGFTDTGLELAVPTLERIRASGANCILALGQQALELCTGIPDKIMKWRGSILKGDERVGSKKVVATVHPSATLKGVYLWRYLIINDMARAVEESKTEALNLPIRTIHLRPSLADAMEYMDMCRRNGRFCTDLEAVNHRLSCFGLAPNKDEAMVIPLTAENGDYWSEEDEQTVMLAYANLMHDPDVEKINQNLVGFDGSFLLLQNHIHVRGPMRDPMIAQSVLYPEFNKGLDFIASIHTREPYWKDEGKMWKNEGGDFPTFWRYNGKDCCVALEAWDVLADELRRRQFWDTYNRHERMAQVLMFMSVDGLALDKDGLEAANIQIEREINSRLEELHSIAEWEFNPLSPAQCKKYFYETKGLPPYKNTAGGITTDDKAISRIFRKTNMREAKLTQEIRGLKKLKGTYLEVETDPDGRLRCSWNPRGTWTGRLSSSKTIMGRGMNLCNLDPRFKSFIVPDEEGSYEQD